GAAIRPVAYASHPQPAPAVRHPVRQATAARRRLQQPRGTPVFLPPSALPRSVPGPGLAPADGPPLRSGPRRVARPRRCALRADLLPGDRARLSIPLAPGGSAGATPTRDRGGDGGKPLVPDAGACCGAPEASPRP